jgi:transcriptional regulator with XRE-family HTH domain
MISDQEILTRIKITGVLLRQARLHANLHVDVCAAALSREPVFIVRAEEGQEALTLPQLESLAQVLDVPLEFLLGEQELPAKRPASDSAYYEQLMTLRRKIVGVILQQARMDAERTLNDVAAVLDWEPERLQGVEWGEEPISLVELQVLAEFLGISQEDFIEAGEPSRPADVPEPSARARQAAPGTAPLVGRRPVRLPHLSSELQEFVTKPINGPYLQIAKSLSEMPADILRKLASGLFEITY